MNTETDPDRPVRSSPSDRGATPTKVDDNAREAEAAAVADAETGDAEAPRRAGRTPPVDDTADEAPRPSLRRRLPWLLALLGLIGTIGFAVAWQGAKGDPAPPSASAEGESAAMAAAAKTFSQALTNFDGATIDRDFDRIVALSSGEFRGQADGFFSTKVRKQLKEAQASSRGEVRSAYVQSFEGDRGTVFLVLDQTIANNTAPKPKADTLRMELSLTLVKGEWRVGRVDVLTAPSGGDTGAGVATGTPDTGSGG